MAQTVSNFDKFDNLLSHCKEEVQNVNEHMKSNRFVPGYSVTLESNSSADVTISVWNHRGEKFSEFRAVSYDDKFILTGANKNAEPVVTDSVLEARAYMNRFKAEFV